MTRSLSGTRLWSGQVGGRLILLVVSFTFIAPFLWMVSTALKDTSQVMAYPPIWIPQPLRWGNFSRAVQYIPFLQYLKNTVFFCTFSVLGVLISCPMVAYSLSRVRWALRDVLLIVVLGTLMIPFPVTMIPLFVIFARMGWVNSFKPLILPAFLGNAFYIFLLRQFFMTIPEELCDSARIDGASDFNIFTRIVLPLSKPVLAVVALFQFLGSWNDFLGPLIYLHEDSKYPLAIGLQFYRATHVVEWPLLMAASTLIVIPTVIVFFLTQKTFVEGITLTGLRG